MNLDLGVRDDEGKVMSVRYEAVNAMLLHEFLKEHRNVGILKRFRLVSHRSVKCASTHRPSLVSGFSHQRSYSARWHRSRLRPNENKMSDGGRGRASLAVEVCKSSQM